MNNFNYENNSDGDWDDKGDLSWHEPDWQQYLKRHDKEIERFIQLYEYHLERENRLDEIAHKMGWDSDDWSISYPSSFDDEPWSNQSNKDDEFSGSIQDSDPYTVLKHPVFVVCCGIYKSIRIQWEKILSKAEANVQAKACWQFSEALNQGERNIMMALQSLDMGDFSLAICQLKRTLGAINHTMSLTETLIITPEKAEQNYQRDIHLRLFDIREICLKIIEDCREEIERYLNDDDLF